MDPTAACVADECRNKLGLATQQAKVSQRWKKMIRDTHSIMLRKELSFLTAGFHFSRKYTMAAIESRSEVGSAERLGTVSSKYPELSEQWGFLLLLLLF